MHITYQASEDDLVRAGMLMLRKKSPFLAYMPWLGAVLLLAIIGELLTNAASRQSLMRADHIPKLAFGLIFPVFFVLLPWLTKRTLRRQFRTSPVLSEPRTLQADFTGLHFRSESVSSDVAWSAYTGFFEDKANFLIIQQGKVAFVPIPKRQLTPGQVEEVRSTFETYLPRK